MDSRAFRRFRRNKGALAGLVLVVAVTLLGIAGPWFAPHDPVEQFTDVLLLDNGLPAGPGVSPDHPLGGDILGRDELSRLLSGARVSMLVAYLATALAVLIGVTLGLVSGYVGGRVDSALMRLVDVVLSMPFLLLAIVMQRVFDAPGIWTICIVLGVLSWTTLARVTHRAIHDAATAMFGPGDFSPLANAMPGGDVAEPAFVQRLSEILDRVRHCAFALDQFQFCGGKGGFGPSLRLGQPFQRRVAGRLDGTAGLCHLRL